MLSDERFEIELLLGWDEIQGLSDAVFWHRVEQERQLGNSPKEESIPHIRARLQSMIFIETFLEDFKNQVSLDHIRLRMEK